MLPISGAQILLRQKEQYGHISKWDVSHVTSMDNLFCEKMSLNEDIRAWGVSSVTTMQSVFCCARAFSQLFLVLEYWSVRLYMVHGTCQMLRTRI
jgi:hypothetical protein